MHSKVYIKNINFHPLNTFFKGEEVNIEPEDYWRDKLGNRKEFDLFEANDFRGTYHPAPFDSNGRIIDDPKYYKKIVLEPIADAPAVVTEVPAHKCMAKGCKHVSPSSEELEAHMTVQHASLQSLVLPEQDERIKKKKAA